MLAKAVRITETPPNNVTILKFWKQAGQSLPLRLEWIDLLVVPGLRWFALARKTEQLRIGQRLDFPFGFFANCPGWSGTGHTRIIDLSLRLVNLKVEMGRD